MITKKLRFKILARDKFTCRYCGSDSTQSPLEVDHILPVSKGGTDEITNLFTACSDCNAGKNNLVLREAPKGDQIFEDEVVIKKNEKYFPIRSFRISNETYERLCQYRKTKDQIWEVVLVALLDNVLQENKAVIHTADEVWKEKIEPFTNLYAPSLLTAFEDHWRAKNGGGKKERWQMEKVFDIERRLKTWQRNDDKWNFQKSQKFVKVEEKEEVRKEWTPPV